jgi:nucleoside-diphosphate-sugar epimerase
VKVSILGCGWFGTTLARSLSIKDFVVKGSTTSSNKLDEVRTHLVKLATAADSVFDPVFFDCDVLVIANNVRMNNVVAYLARINYTIELIKRFKIQRVIFISSTSVYGEPNEVVDETTVPHPETLSAKLLCQAEQLFQNAPFNCVILRFAGLFGPGRDPGRFFAGKTSIPNGLAAVNLLHLDDAVGLTLQLIDEWPNNKVINAVSPDHPARVDFYTKAARRSGLPGPVFITELSQWKIVNSSYMDYKYRYNLLA